AVAAKVVVSGVTEDGVLAGARTVVVTGDEVIALAAVEHVGTVAAFDVVAGALRLVGLGGNRRAVVGEQAAIADDEIVVGAALEDVGSAGAGDHVVAGAVIDGVNTVLERNERAHESLTARQRETVAHFARVAEQDIVASETVDSVVAFISEDEV